MGHSVSPCRNVIGAALAAVLWAPPVAQAAISQPFDDKAALELSRGAIGQRLGDHVLVTAEGNRISLSAFRGKPLVISLVYTSCHHTCPTMTRQLAAAVEVAREAVGRDSFNVLTVGFDTAVDTPDRMRRFASERGIDDPQWMFAAVDPVTIKAMTRELGFSYFPSPRGFEHLAQTSIIDAEGAVHQQVYGELIHRPALVEPIKQLVWDLEADPASLAGWLKGVKLFCTVYDPTTGRYEFEYSFFIGLFIGVLTLGSVAVFVIRAWRQTNRSRAA